MGSAKGEADGSRVAGAPPSLVYLAIEGRALLEFGGALLASPWLVSRERGDGHAVIVLPGFATTDAWTAPLRGYLRHLGYAAEGWKQGRNFGLGRNNRAALLERLDTLHGETGQRVSLVGWSLGGMIARELARAAPGDVRSVISLGSPFGGDPRSTNVSRVYQWLGKARPVDWAAVERRKPPPPVPTTAIHSRTDGVVSWRCSLEQASPTTENIEVCGSHTGLTVNPAVLAVLADRLSQPDGAWRPYGDRGWRFARAVRA